jgi:hypothetical protein
MTAGNNGGGGEVRKVASAMAPIGLEQAGLLLMRRTLLPSRRCVRVVMSGSVCRR